MTPSRAPFVLLNVLSRPLTKTKNCVGPTAPIESGGKALVSLGPVSASKLVPTVCAVYGPELMVIEELVVLEAVRAGPGAVCGSNLAPGACGRFSRPGISNSR